MRNRLVEIIGMAAGDMAQRRSGLRADEVGMRPSIWKIAFGAVLDPPDHHGADLDRIADQVVDLQLAVLMVAHPLRHPARS